MSGYMTRAFRCENLKLLDIAMTLSEQERELYTFLLYTEKGVVFQLCTIDKVEGTRKYRFKDFRKYKYFNYTIPFPSHKIKEKGIKIRSWKSNVVAEDPNSKFLGWVLYNPIRETLTIYNIKNIPESYVLIMKALGI